MSTDIECLLSKYSFQIEESIQKSITDFGVPENTLRQATEYSLMSGGKRIRPLLVFIMADALEKNYDVSDAGIAIEYVHTSTLIADDLPCMDNDDERRNKPTLHIAFNEATALLSSYALIAAAYDRLRLNAVKLSQKAGLEQAWMAYNLVLENVAFNTGVSGVLGGQFEDLFAEDYSQENFKKIIHQKTGSLFEMAFVMGWLFGGGEFKYLEIVKRMSAQFGLLFQVGDDLLDRKQDIAKKTSFNYAAVFGVEEAQKVIKEASSTCRECIDILPINDKELLLILDYILERV